ncbi:putative AAA family ATPase [Candidatus Termititenax aidoneus]|uniref:AAA family ATPase n=1 Tax=Termititenax aidoneus TaxID=2218524 RepID=A0A388TBW2_TERA1|nr:putative AAA family ATPase [Candidatus Termititenax aidoneus]
MQDYIVRTMQKTLRQAVKHSPIIALTGPRQTGKSTLLRHLFPRYNYISFDAADLRLAAKNDPQLFVENIQKPVIMDEIQYVPEILPYLKLYVDKYTTTLKNSEIAGAFILTGSQVFTLMAGLTESLAGRIALFELLPFSFKELGQKPRRPLNCYRQILKGFYPVPNTAKRSPQDYYGDYLATYIERDVRQILNIKDVGAFQSFVQVLAGRAGNLLNIQEVARDCAISHATAKNWLSILETSRIIYILRPYYRNITKRTVKTPKLYFTDTGLLAYLLKYKDAETLAAGGVSGAIFENMVIMEFLKSNNNSKAGWDFYFYRDNNGVEIDLIIDKGRAFEFYEIKSAKTLRPEMAKGLSAVNLTPAKKFVLSFNEHTLPLAKNVLAAPWWAFL